jgi:transcriptional regulator with XRE-family HTH domain
VRALGRQGIGWRRAAELAGISKSTMRSLMFGASGREPSSQIRPETATAILAVPATSRDVAAGTPVNATGTRRRLEALVATGWSRAKLGERLGIEPTGMSELLRREHVTAGRARAVADLYDELWDRPPPEREWREKISAARSRNYAREHGWAPPAAWDDDLIDDPHAPRPAGWQRSSDVARGAELAEEAAELLRQDYTRELAAGRLGVSRNTLDRTLARHQSAGREHEAQRARFAAAGATPAAGELQVGQERAVEREAG